MIGTISKRTRSLTVFSLLSWDSQVLRNEVIVAQLKAGNYFSNWFYSQLGFRAHQSKERVRFTLRGKQFGNHGFIWSVILIPELVSCSSLLFIPSFDFTSVLFFSGCQEHKMHHFLNLLQRFFFSGKPAQCHVLKRYM